MSTNRFGIVSFDSIKHLQSEIQRNNWVLARKENAKLKARILKLEKKLK